MKCPKYGKRRRKNAPCIYCRRLAQKRRARSARGLVLLRYRRLLHRCKVNRWDLPDFTKDEFVVWTLNDSDFKRIYRLWVISGFKKWQSPSIDRIDAAVSYLKNNLRWITWRENWSKGRNEHGPACEVETEKRSTILRRQYLS